MICAPETGEDKEKLYRYYQRWKDEWEKEAATHWPMQCSLKWLCQINRESSLNALVCFNSIWFAWDRPTFWCEWNGKDFWSFERKLSHDFTIDGEMPNLCTKHKYFSNITKSKSAVDLCSASIHPLLLYFALENHLNPSVAARQQYVFKALFAKMFSGSALLDFGHKLRIWRVPGVSLSFHASHSKCQHHATNIVWKSSACSTPKLYSFVAPCFLGNAWH